MAYSLISLFFLLFSRIYEHFSFGESSSHMHYLFFVPLVGGMLLLLLENFLPQFSRLSLNLWNSAIATATTGVLLRGIINLSGRSTTLDSPYYLVALGLASLSLASCLLPRK